MKPDSVELFLSRARLRRPVPGPDRPDADLRRAPDRILLSEPALDVPLPQGSLQLAELARQQAAASKCAEFCWRTGWTPT
ncbi:hypothetical protein IU483_27920 [Streptomyces gardneri]|nr:hypothetical protein [Streptomyces gardneri]